MTIIDRYLARSFVSGYLILLAVGIGMYTLTDLLINLDEFTEDRSRTGLQVIGMMIDFYAYNVPYYYSLLGGPLMAIAASFTLGRMLRNNELTALVAAGVPLQRLVIPMVACTLVLTGLWVANRELVIPKIAAKISRSHDDVVGSKVQGVYCARDKNNAILTALRIRTDQDQLWQVFIFESTGPDEPDSLIVADEARWIAQRRMWKLQRGRRIVMGDAGTSQLNRQVRSEPVEEYPFTLSPDELVLRRGSQWADLLSLKQLNQLVRSPNLPNRPTIDMSRHVRLTQPLIQCIMLLLAVPYFLTREPTNVLVSGGRALLVTGLFFLVAFIAHSVVRDETYAALIAWFPMLLFGPIAVIQLANMKT